MCLHELSVFNLIALILSQERDSSGVYGGILHYALVFALVGSAFLAFFYFWTKGKLDMDESPKIQMMKDEGEE